MKLPRRRRLLPLVALSLVACLVSGRAAPPRSPQALPDAPPAVRDALLSGDTARAVKLLDGLLEKEAGKADAWLYLKGVALAQGEKPAEAVAVLRKLETGYPKSPWVAKARFLRAEAHRALRQFAEAEKIYEGEARRLMAPERKGKLAGIYLEFADRLSAPPAPEKPDAPKPDYKRARVLYGKVLELGASRALEDRALFRMAECMRAAKDWKEAVKDYTAYLKRFDPSRREGKGPGPQGGAHVLEARYHIAECYLKKGQRDWARRSWEDLAAAIPGALQGDARVKAQRLRAETLFSIASTYRVGPVDSTLFAVAALRKFLAAYPAAEHAPRAAFSIGEDFAKIGRDEEALTALDDFLAGKGYKVQGEKAREESARLQQHALHLKGSILRRQEKFAEAIQVWKEYVARYPTGSDWAASQQAIVEAEYALGETHRREKRWKEARGAWSGFLDRHPLDARSPRILYQLGELYAEEAAASRKAAGAAGGKSSAAKLGGLYRASIQQWQKLVRKYPKSEEASLAQFRIGEVLETRLKDLDEAVKAYRAVTWGSRVNAAKVRLARMTAKDLAVFTERIWRTNEPARVKLQLRNIEKVQVHLYKLDLQGYFRKHRGIRGIENLDLDLIRPDKVVEIATEGYARYRPIEQEITLPVKGPGVFAVAVTAHGLRATTLVIQSDLDIIVKSSRKELLVFAENMREGRPMLDVEVLVALPQASSAGTTVTLVEGRTGKDGVYRYLAGKDGEGSDALLPADRVAVFASSGGQCASNALRLQGLGVSRGLQPRGFVTTDRPAYRRGQTVHVRAILRHVDDKGSYTFREGQVYRVEVADSQGRIFQRRRIALGAFGTLHDSVALDLFAPVGKYTIRCQAAEGPTFSGSFRVEEYKLEQIHVTFDVPRSVYFRGERVEGTIEARYHYGEAVADAELRYTLPDGKVVTTRTDKDGKVRFSFATGSFPREMPLVIRADLTGEHVTALHTVLLAVRGYAASVSTLRSVFLADEKFDVTVSTTSATGEPAGRAMKLRVFRREAGSRIGGSSARRLGEVLVQEFDVPTDKATGKAVQGVKIARGGRYILRVEGVDRFANPVTTQTMVFISDNKDEVKLRLLTDTQHVKVGETMDAVLYNRAGPGLALLTYEGEEILSYRLVKLAPGANKVRIDVSHRLFPNFVLAASLMRGAKFYEASAPFEVTRELKVRLKPAKETYLPGEKATVSVEVTDQLGRPARAELSLAVVDASLLDRYPRLAGDITRFFQRGARRVAALRTTTSCTFSYKGATSTIPQAVQREAERLSRSGSGEARGAARLDAGGTAAQQGAPVEQQFTAGSRPLAGVDVWRLARQADGQGQNGQAMIEGAPFAPISTNAAPGAGRAAPAPAPQAVRRAFLETAFWAPAVVTDEKGRATVTFEVPSQATRWQILGQAVTVETVVGQGEAAFTARKELFLEMKLPAVLTEGDRPRFLLRLHNLTGARGKASLKLRLTHGAQKETIPLSIDVAEKGVTEHLLEPTRRVALCGELVIEAEVTARLGKKEFSDAVARRIPVRPWGLELADSESGVLSADTTLWLELPPEHTYRDRKLTLAIGSGLEGMLLDEALDRAPLCSLMRQAASTVTQAGAAGELLGVCAVIEYLEALGRTDAPDLRLLREKAGGLLSRLVATQLADGGWAWAGRGEHGGAETTSMAMWAIGRARQLGLPCSPATMERGIAFLQKGFSGAPQQANELKAMLLHALAVHRKGDFGFANRLYRMRASLSPAAVAYTALALGEMGKDAMAEEVALALEKQALTLKTPGRRETQLRWSAKKNTAWNRAPVEMAALAILALERSRPRSPNVAGAIAYLTAARPWRPTKARGLALAAVAYYYKKTRPAAADAEVHVRVGGRDLGVVRFGGKAGTHLLTVADADLADGKIRVDLSLAGRGQPSFVATLTGFSPEMRPKDGTRFRIAAHAYRAAPPVYHGRPVKTGFGILRDQFKSWENLVAHLPLGSMTRVRLDIDRRYRASSSTQDDDYLVAEVSLPAGTTVLEGSVKGSFDYFQEGDGKLTFFVGSRRYVADITYTLLGYLPGTYRVLPVVVRSLYDPSLVAVGKTREFTVLSRTEKSPDAYRPTPDELYHLGTAHFQDGQFQEARELLEALLLDWQQNLENTAYRETARMLLFVCIEARDAPAIVRYFEIIKEKYPDLTIPFDKVLAVGEAYRSIEEYERALLVFRATIEETFGKDLKVAGTLEQQGEFLGAVATMQRLWLEFPDLPPVVGSYLTLADKLYTKAPGASSDRKLKDAGVDEAALMRAAVRVLSRFLTLYSKDPLADDAGLNLVSAFTALEDYQTAFRLSGRLAERFQEPRFHDSFLYSQAVAAWYLNRYDEAVKLATQVAAAQYTDVGGRTQTSDNKSLALYIIGQIYHARRQVARAIEYYEKVRKEYPDAAEAIENFRKKKLQVPEVTTTRPGSPVKLALTYRNVKEAEVLVYAVDLMTLYLREKNLTKITQVNLAGIAPSFRKRIPLGKDVDYLDHKRTETLPLKKSGAYLAICRGDELHASGLILVTPLELDVSEERSGRVRVNVLKTADKTYVRGVEVKVIGSTNKDFQAGKTDPRGVFVADGIQGAAAVIARNGTSQYAFYRGTTLLGATRRRQGKAPAQPAVQTDLFENVRSFNRSMQQQRGKAFNLEMNKAREGIQAQQAK